MKVFLAAAALITNVVFFPGGHGSIGNNNPPTNTVAPVVSPSSAVVGTVESTTNGTWTGVPSSFTYQWNQADISMPIGGATASTYTPVSGDIGHTLDVTVTAHNSFGSASATSGATSAVVAVGSSICLVDLPILCPGGLP